MSKAYEDLLTSINIQAQEIVLVGVELRKCSNLPTTLSHDGFHKGSDFTKRVQCLSLSGPRLFMLIVVDGNILYEGHIVDE